MEGRKPAFFSTGLNGGYGSAVLIGRSDTLMGDSQTWCVDLFPLEDSFLEATLSRGLVKRRQKETNPM